VARSQGRLMPAARRLSVTQQTDRGAIRERECATKPPGAPGDPVQGAKARAADAARPPSEGHETIGSRIDPRARMRDRAQTVSCAGHASPRREGKGRGCGPPAA